MIFGQIAVLADAVGVLRPVKVRACIGRLLASICVVTVLAHALCIEGTIDVRALGDYAARASLLRLFGLLRLARLANFAGPARLLTTT